MKWGEKKEKVWAEILNGPGKQVLLDDCKSRELPSKAVQIVREKVRVALTWAFTKQHPYTTEEHTEKSTKK